MAGGGFIPGWRVVTASVTGPNHANVGLENQDAMRCGRVGDDVYVMAVADGAGSAARAAHGSLLAVDAAHAAAQLTFASRPRQLIGWLEAAQRFAYQCLSTFDELVERAMTPIGARGGSDRGQNTRTDFATTLLAVVAAPPYFAYCCVGDGFLVVEHEPGRPHLVLPPPAGRQSASETVFVTSADRADNLRHGVIADPAIAAIALCTDGLAEGMLDVTSQSEGGKAIAPPEFASYFKIFREAGVDASELGRKLQSKEFAASSGDDKTMIMAVRR